MFDSLSLPDARPVAVMKKVLAIPLALFFVTAAVSGYRAYYQVRGSEVERVMPCGGPVKLLRVH